MALSPRIHGSCSHLRRLPCSYGVVYGRWMRSGVARRAVRIVYRLAGAATGHLAHRRATGGLHTPLFFVFGLEERLDGLLDRLHRQRFPGAALRQTFEPGLSDCTGTGAEALRTPGGQVVKQQTQWSR